MMRVEVGCGGWETFGGSEIYRDRDAVVDLPCLHLSHSALGLEPEAALVTGAHHAMRRWPVRSAKIKTSLERAKSSQSAADN